jgi:subtilase family serine protease
MSIQKKSWGRGVLAGGALLALSCVQAGAQTANAQSSGEQKSRVPARVLDTVDDTNRTVLRGNVHPKARAEFDRGTVADAQPVTRIVMVLQRSAEQEAALRQLMEEQQSKNSPNFHAWLTPEQFGKQFGPADADVQAVTDWLTAHGFHNIKVAKGKTLVEFSGNVGQVRSAFGTEIRKYNVNGEEHFANASDPQIPAALVPVVRGIRSLHNFHPRPQMKHLGSFRRMETGEIRPLFTYTDSNGQFFGLGPADFATIYNVTTGPTGGANISIAIVGQSNINVQDVTDFRAMFGLPAYSPFSCSTPNQCQFNVILNGPDPGLVDGDEGESDLDVEWAGAVAPGATINFVTTETTQTDGTFGIDGSAMYIVDNNISPILSESYGSCEAGLGTGGNAFYNSLWQQAAAQGITVVISAGDNGSAGCDPGSSSTANPDAAASGLAISGIASTPFNIAMGGTDFDDANNQSTFWSITNTSTTTPPAVAASAKGYIPETTWNDSCAAGGLVSGCTSTIINGNISNGSDSDLVAGSGGPSAMYAKPSYQVGFGDAVRDIPDVSLFSSDGQNKSFYIICQSDQDPSGGTGCNLTTNATVATHDFQAVGGTSAATPTFAAIMALVNQQTGQRQGVANYVLYSLAKGTGNVCPSASTTLPNACVFYDVAKGNNSVACVAGTPNCSNPSTSANQFGILLKPSTTTPGFAATAGYDLATGLGTVNVANLVSKWAAATPSLIGTSVTLAGPTSPPFGTSATFTGTVTKASGTATPTGLVLLEDQTTGTVVDSTTLPASGTYSLTTTLLPAATSTYTLVAHYGGDGTFAGHDSNTLTMTVPKQNSKVLVDFITFSASGAETQNTTAANVSYGSAYIMRVDVTNTSGTPCQNATNVITFACPTGTIQLLDGTMPLPDFPNAQNPNATNVARLNDRGFAEDQPIQLTPGSYNLNATYTADATSSFNSSTSPSNSVAVTVTQATTTTSVIASPTSIVSGGSVTLTATVSTSSNGAGPTGTVQFKNGASNLGAAVSCTPTSGIASNTGSAFCTATLSTTLSEFIPLTQPRTRMRPQIPVLPLGIVSLLLIALLALQRRLSMGKRIGYAAAGLVLLACVAAGIAGCSGSGSGGGGGSTRSITATYTGDSNYSGSTSAAVSVRIQ